MITRWFVHKEDDETGDRGWIPEGMDNANISYARGIAHDTLEHAVDKVNGFEGEMMALGALMWGRGIAGTLPNSRTGLKYDIAFSLENIIYKDQTLKDPGKTYRLSNIDEGDWFEEIFEEQVYQGILQFRNETREDGLIYGLTDSEVKRRIIGWLRRGVRAAIKMYYTKHKLDSYEVAMLFDKVMGMADKPKYKADNYYTGDRLKVSVNLATQEVKMKVFEQQD